jgi:hypothetical protein
VLGLVGLLGLLGSLAVRAFASPARRLDPSTVSADPASEARAPSVALPTTAVAGDAATVHALAPADDHLPTMTGEPHDAPKGPQHPHPITPEHLRIYRENNLLGALNGAMDEKDASGMRRLLAEYREEYPEDAHELAHGYEIIAACLEHPGDASATAARRYYDTETASTLRRYVRRHCFEPAP